MTRRQCWVLAGLLASAACGAAFGFDNAPSPTDTPSPVEPHASSLPALQFGDEPVEPFDPLVPAPAETEQQRAARAWYMTGKIHEARVGDPDELGRAIDAYRKAVELDPTSLATYEALIPVLYTRDQKDEARTLLKRLREVLKEAGPAQSAEVQGFLQEAEELIKGP